MNTKKLQAKNHRAHPSRAYTGRIDQRGRVALPPEMPWRVGMRVYFTLTKDGAIQVSKAPTRLYQGRMLSSRIQRMHQPLGCRQERDGQGIRALRP